MSTNCCRFLPILVLSGLLTAIPSAQAVPPTAAPADEDFFSTYPQVVRLSYVEGDVRISRGALADKQQSKDGATATGWEQVASNLPIESGYSLVTGKGRAEIEFEDASTVYLADNSVLSFTQLTTQGGVPYTEIALIAGTATLNVRTRVPAESFIARTPTDTIALTYPRAGVLRIGSYLDAVSITPQQDLSVRLPGMTAGKPQVVGQTQTFRNSHLVAAPVLMDTAKASEWDTWVANRIGARDEAMSAAMKDAGLAAPIPGLAEMNGQGKFFDCAPYGKCWEPARGWDGRATDVAQTETKPETEDGTQSALAASVAQAPSGAPQAAPKAKKTEQSAQDAYVASHPGATLWTEDYVFPCSAYGTHDLYGRDPVTGQQQLIWSELAGDGFYAGYPYDVGFSHPVGFPYPVGYRRWGFSPFWGFDAFNGYDPWEWAVCHSGSWIRWNHRYAWVVGLNRHHVPPVHWVHGQRTIGFVPIHPWDRPGKQPVNLKDGIFRVTHKGESVKRVVEEEGKPVKLLDEPPKEFRRPVLEPLRIAEMPKAEGHSALMPNRTVAVGGSSGAVAGAAVGSARGSRTVGNGFAVARGTALGGSAPIAAKDAGTPITFDRRSQSFNVERSVVQGGRPTTVAEPIGGRGGMSQQGGNNSFAGPNSNGGGYSNGGGSARSSNAPSYNGGGGARPSGSAPSYNGGGASRSYTPSPSFNGGGGGGVSRPSAPSAPAPSAPSAPASSGGGSSAPSGGSASHK